MRELLSIIALFPSNPHFALRKLRAWIGQERGALAWVWLLRFGSLICLTVWVVFRSRGNIEPYFNGFLIVGFMYVFQIATAIGGSWRPQLWQNQRIKLYQNLIEIVLLSLAIVHFGSADGVLWTFYLIPMLSAIRFLHNPYRTISIILTISISTFTGWLVYKHSEWGLFIPLTINLLGLSILFVARRTSVNPGAFADQRSEVARILDHYRSGICIIDHERRVQFVNAGLQRYFGRLTPGIKCYQYLGCIGENCTACMIPEHAVRNTFRHTMLAPSGRKHEFEVTVHPLAEDNHILLFLDPPRTIRLELYEHLLDTIVDNDEVHFNNALKQLLQSIREQFCAETAAIFWFKEGKLERALDSGPELPFAESYEPGQGVTGLTLITTSYLRFGRPVRVNNLDEKPEVLQTNVARYRQALPSGKVRHLLAVPINGRRHVIGVIRLVNRLLDPNSHHLDPHGFHSVHEIDLRMIAERLARAIEYRQLTREKEQQLAETQRFYRIYAASTAERNVFETITEEAMAAFPEASKCEIRRLNRSNRTLEYVCARHRRGFDYGSEPIALGGIAGRALREERIQVVPDTSQDADFVAGKVTIGAMMVAPLIGQLGVVGTLSLDYPAPHAFSDEEQRRFTALAMHAALAAEMFWRRMQNEQLRDHIQRINEDISRGVESVYKNVLAALRELIGYDSASIQLRYGNYLKIVAHDGFVDPDALEFISFDIHDQRLPNFYVMRDGMLLIVADVRQDYPHFETEAERYQSKEIRSILYIPMFYRQKIIGMIALDSHVVNFYRFGDGIIGTLLASAAASAIDNARLVEAQERQQESLRRLLKSSTDIIGINDEQELIDSYAQLGIQLFFCEHCAIFITHAQGAQGVEKFDFISSSLRQEFSDNYVELAKRIFAKSEIVRLSGEELSQYYENYGLSDDDFYHLLSGRSRSLLAAFMSDQQHHTRGIVLLENHWDENGFPATAEELLTLFCYQLVHSLSVINLRRSIREQLGIDVHDLANLLQGTVIFRINKLIRQSEYGNIVDQLKEKLQSINRATKYIYQELHRVQDDLRGRIDLEQPFAEALEEYIELVRERIGDQVQIHKNLPDHVNMPPEVLAILFRICRESLANIAKHAGFTNSPDERIDISLNIEQAKFVLCIADNGKGLPTDKNLDHLENGYGIHSIKEWARRIGASATIKNRVGGGVVVEVQGSIV